MILCIESATYTSSVALISKNQVIGENFLPDSGKSHSGELPVAVSELIQEHDAGDKLEAIAICKGPGSYTGLRIGVSLAKGLCYGYQLPLIAIDSLTIMAQGMKASHDSADLYVPLLDARRMEVYTSRFDSNLHQVGNIHAQIVDDETFKPLLNSGKVCFGGNGSEKIKPLYAGKDAIFIEENVLLASNMQAMATAKFDKKEFEDLVEFEPFYLKEFIAGAPSRKIMDILGI